MIGIFQADWEAGLTATAAPESAMDLPMRRMAKMVAKHIHMKPLVDQVLERVMDRAGKGDVPFEPSEVAQTVREAFREEVHDAVLHAMQDMAARAASEPVKK